MGRLKRFVIRLYKREVGGKCREVKSAENRAHVVIWGFAEGYLFEGEKTRKEK